MHTGEEVVAVHTTDACLVLQAPQPITIAEEDQEDPDDLVRMDMAFNALVDDWSRRMPSLSTSRKSSRAPSNASSSLRMKSRHSKPKPKPKRPKAESSSQLRKMAVKRRKDGF